MEIIKAQKEHIENILIVTKKAFAIYKQHLNADIKLKALEETYDDVLNDIKNNYVFIAVINDKIAGVIRLEKLSGDITYIYRFSVDPDIHNAGVGTELIRHAINLSEELGAKAVTLHSNSQNLNLSKFYLGKGFYIQSTDLSRGYARALFVKEIRAGFDLTPAFQK